MNFHQWGHLMLIIALLCLAFVATDSQLQLTTTVSDNPEETATPAPGGEEKVTGVEVGTPAPVSTASETPNVTGGPTVGSEASTLSTTESALTEACRCDLTTGFCDIGCCCDTVDCEVANLSSVFTACSPKTISGICIEKWLIFRSNVDSSLVTVTDTLFCVQNAATDQGEASPALSKIPSIGTSYHFTPPAATKPKHHRDFYQADDIIQTYSSTSSMKSFLHQPSPGAASSFCFNRNPARFLRSLTLSCSRKLTSETCTADPKLDARSYFTDLALLKIPVSEQTPPPDLLVPITAQASDWAAPSEQNGVCINVTKKVELVIGYTSKGELTFATVNVVFTDVELNQFLMQDHTVRFQPVPQRPKADIPSVGIRAGAPIIGRFDEAVMPMTMLGVSQGGECSSDSSRSLVLFQHDTITGCVFRSTVRNCSELRSQIHTILEGLTSPDVIAMNSGSEPDWTRVIRQGCPVSKQESCDTGCTLPHSLSLRVLWARLGPLDLPQNYILGAKSLFQCAQVKCPLMTPLTLTYEVVFADTTVFPEPPIGQPQFDWKFPFGFFTRGSAEIDGHFINRGHAQEVSWSLVIVIVTLRVCNDY